MHNYATRWKHQKWDGEPPYIIIIISKYDSVGPVVNLTSTSISPSSITVSWLPPLDGNNLIRMYYINTDDAPELVAPSQSQTFTNLVPNTTYRFSVSAENGVGRGVSTTLLVTTLPMVCFFLIN